MKKSNLLFIVFFGCMSVYSQTRATLDSLTTEYNECVKITKDKVNCTKELFWAYQDLQFDFHRKSVKGLDSIAKIKSNIACGEWVKAKDFFVGKQLLDFKRKYPSEKISEPSKAAENDAYMAFSKICDFFMVRINALLQIIESQEKE